MEIELEKERINTVDDATQMQRDAICKFLELHSERPGRGILRCLAIGVIIGIFLLLDSSLIAPIPLLRIIALFITGWLIAFAGWGTERLWYSTLGRMFLQPLKWYAYLTRIPFWFIAGGMGYTAGLLISERSGWLSVSDIPVKSLFISGGYFGLIMQILLQTRIYIFFRRYYRTEQTETERSRDDKD